MNQVAVVDRPKGLTAVMAGKYHMEANKFLGTIKSTVMPRDASDEQVMAFLMVAHEYGLNPLTKEVYAFPAKGGGIQPIVSIDGWMKLMNDHPNFDGIEFEDHLDDDGNLSAVTAKVFRKDRGHPTSATEYMVECKRNTDPWRQWPRRMLRHKAAIQAARYAFSFSGFIDEDEYGRMKDVTPEKASFAEKFTNREKDTDGFDADAIEAEIEDIQESSDSLPPDQADDGDSELETSETDSSESPPFTEDEKAALRGYHQALNAIEAKEEGTREEFESTHRLALETFLDAATPEVLEVAKEVNAEHQHRLAGRCAADWPAARLEEILDPEVDD
ncbi:MAG: phage recombination protein Bet [Pseudomonadota bacterium]